MPYITNNEGSRVWVQDEGGMNQAQADQLASGPLRTQYGDTANTTDTTYAVNRGGRSAALSPQLQQAGYHGEYIAQANDPIYSKLIGQAGPGGLGKFIQTPDGEIVQAFSPQEWQQQQSMAASNANSDFTSRALSVIIPGIAMAGLGSGLGAALGATTGLGTTASNAIARGGVSALTGGNPLIGAATSLAGSQLPNPFSGGGISGNTMLADAGGAYDVRPQELLPGDAGYMPQGGYTMPPPSDVPSNFPTGNYLSPDQIASGGYVSPTNFGSDGLTAGQIAAGVAGTGALAKVVGGSTTPNVDARNIPNPTPNPNYVPRDPNQPIIETNSPRIPQLDPNGNIIHDADGNPIMTDGTVDKVGDTTTDVLSPKVTTGTGNALSRILDGTATTADWTSILGTGVATGLSLYNSDKQTQAYKDLANQQLALGAPYRDRLAQSYADPSAFLKNSPDIQTSVQMGTDALSRSLSRQGNPAGNGAALQQIQDYATNGLYGQLGNERNRLANFGGLSNFNAAAPSTQTNAITSQGSGLTNLAGGISAMVNPVQQNSLASLLKQYGINTL